MGRRNQVSDAPRISTGQAITNGIFGAFRVARGDFGGYDNFPNTIQGFWQSFWAAPLTIPIRLMLLASTFSLATAELGTGTLVTVETIGFLLDWAIFPLVMIPVARMMNITNRYIPFIIAYNWTKLPIYLVLSLSMLVAMGGGGEEINPIGGLLVLVGTGWSFWLRWRVARDMLQLTGLPAASIVLLDTALAVIMTGIIGQIIGPVAPVATPVG